MSFTVYVVELINTERAFIEIMLFPGTTFCHELRGAGSLSIIKVNIMILFRPEKNTFLILITIMALDGY